jgi:hypothetical protein
LKRQAKAATAGSNERQGPSGRGLIVPLIVLFALVVFAPSASAKYVEVGSFAQGSGLSGNGSADGELSHPGQADVNDASGDLYVADTENDRVERFTQTQTAATYLSKVSITAPSGLAVDQADGSVYVSNASGITKFNSDLTSASGWSDPAVSGALAVDPTSGDLLVADQSANLIRRFESDGTPAGSFAAERPLDLAVDPAGKIYAITSTGDVFAGCGAATSSVKKFSAAGVEEATTAGQGLDTPGQIAIDPDDGSIMIAARLNEYWCEQGHRPEIAIFDSTGTAIEAFELTAATEYSLLPGLTARGGGSPRIYAITKDPHGDGYGATRGIAIESHLPPEVSIDPVDSGSVSASEATLEGSVDPNGVQTNWNFEYRIVGESTWFKAPTQSAGSGEAPVDVEADLSGLQPNKEYEARLLASSAVEAVTSSLPNPTFATDAIAPDAATLSPQLHTSGVGSSQQFEATLLGTLNPNNSPTEYWFEWGTSDCSSNPCTSVPLSQDADGGSDFATHFVSRALTDLKPQTTYHFRLVARNAFGMVAGDDVSFTTPAASAACANANNLGAAQLPNCRAWEMVSPPDKNGSNVIVERGRMRSAPSGNAMQFSTLSGFGGNEDFTVAADYLARRTGESGTNGWTTHSIMPAQKGVPGIFLVGNSEPRYEGEFSPDFGRGIFFAFSSVPTTDGPHPMVEQTPNLYLRTDLSTPGPGSYLLVSGCPACTSPLPLEAFEAKPTVIGSNAGDVTHQALSNVTFTTPRQLTADAPASEEKLYEYTEAPTNETQVVSVNATAGQFKLEFKGQVTADIAFDASASSVESMLDSLSSIAPGSVSVTGGPGDAGATSPYVVSFTSGAGIAGTDMPQIETLPGTTPLSGGGESTSAATRLEGGQHTRLASRIPSGGADECNDRGAPACMGSTAVSFDAIGASAMHVVSEDGSRIFFTAGSPRSVYMREDGVRTVKLNASEKAIPDSPQGADFEIASDDGSRIFFTTTEQLVDADNNNSSLDVYMYDASKPPSAPDNLTLVSVGSGGSGSVDTGAPVAGISADGHYAYIRSGNQLVAGEPNVNTATGPGMYAWYDGQLSYVGSASYVDGPRGGLPTEDSRVAADGRHFVFRTGKFSGLVGRGGFEGFDNGKCGGQFCQQIFVYSADSGTLRCASCNPSGKSIGGIGARGASFGTSTADRFLQGASIQGYHLPHPLSDDGRYVFFETPERLVPQDTNGKGDVYEYDTKTEEQHLISSGESNSNTYFADASANGRDVFFDTAEQLSGWDVDRSYDLYDARIDGGFPEPSPPPPSCQGDACQPTPPALNDPTPASSSFKGPGNEQSKKPTPRCPKGKHRIKSRGKSRCVKANKKNHKRAANANRRAGR